MKTNLFLICTCCILLVVAGCQNPFEPDTNKLQEENPIKETSLQEDSYSVSFSIGSEYRTSEAKTSELQKSSKAIPENFNQVKYFLLTIRDSEGKMVVNREKYEKISWTPGFVVSRPLKLPQGTYTLEELILVNINNGVLYATPRAGSLLETVVKQTLPVTFTVLDTDLTVYNQVIDVEWADDAAEDPVAFFGYELGVIDEVAPYYLDIEILDINAIPVSEEIKITSGDWQMAKTIDAGGTRIYIPNHFDDYNVEVSAADGSGYVGDGAAVYGVNSDNPDSLSYIYSIKQMIDRGYHDLKIQLTIPVNVQIVLKGMDGEDVEGEVKFSPFYPYGYQYVFEKEDNLYSKTIYATANTKITAGVTGYNYFSQIYTIEELINSQTTPIEIHPEPASLTFTLLLNQPDDLIDSGVDITIISTGNTTVFSDIPYNTPTPITFLLPSSPVEIIITGDNISTIQNTYQAYELTSYSANKPLTFNPIVSLTCPVMLNKPTGITAETADIQIVSNGTTHHFSSIPYGALTPLSIPNLTNPVEITLSGSNIETITNTYSIAQLFTYTDSDPLQFSPLNSFTFPVILYKPSGFPNSSANITIVSNGLTHSFEDVPLDFRSQISISNVTDPIEVTISGENISQRQYSWTISRLYLITDSDPFELYLSSTLSFPVLVTKPDSITAETVDIKVTSNFYTTEFNDIPYGTQTILTTYGVSNSVYITLSGSDIYSLQSSYTLSQMNSYTELNPLQLSPSAISNQALPFAENFESGIGLWIQDETDNMNWTRHSGSTSSSNTGPSGAIEGSYYLYTEATSNSNRTANLISPYIDFDAQSGEYINMKLHMYGSTMGSIAIYYQILDSNTWEQISIVSGNQGNFWSDFNNSLDHISGQARIKIAATIGYSYYSDICIDNVVIGY